MAMQASNGAQMRILLASGSPRRRELLELTGWAISVQRVDAEESALPDEQPMSMARRLAELKARTAYADFPHADLILAADTIVIDGDRVHGKPGDALEAREMLLDLCGRDHEVITALALLQPASGELHLDACCTVVPMRAYSLAEIEAYVQGGSPLDKAGAYGIQDVSFKPVKLEAMRGCFANVMGLPICHLLRMMRSLGFDSAQDVPTVCQRHNHFDCKIYSQILDGQL